MRGENLGGRGERISNAVKVGRVSAGYVFLETVAFKLDFDGWGKTFYLMKMQRTEKLENKSDVNLERYPLWMWWEDTHTHEKKGKITVKSWRLLIPIGGQGEPVSIGDRLVVCNLNWQKTGVLMLLFLTPMCLGKSFIIFKPGFHNIIKYQPLFCLTRLYSTAVKTELLLNSWLEGLCSGRLMWHQFVG